MAAWQSLLSHGISSLLLIPWETQTATCQVVRVAAVFYRYVPPQPFAEPLTIDLPAGQIDLSRSTGRSPPHSSRQRAKLQVRRTLHHPTSLLSAGRVLQVWQMGFLVPTDPRVKAAILVSVG